MIAVPNTIAPRAYAGLSPMARLVVLLEAIPDDPNDPEYARWQVVEAPAAPAAPPVNHPPLPRRERAGVRVDRRSSRTVGVTAAGRA